MHVESRAYPVGALGYANRMARTKDHAATKRLETQEALHADRRVFSDPFGHRVDLLSNSEVFVVDLVRGGYRSERATTHAETNNHTEDATNADATDKARTQKATRRVSEIGMDSCTVIRATAVAVRAIKPPIVTT